MESTKTKEYEKLLFLFNQLTHAGRNKLIERATELVTLGYTPTGKRSGLNRIK